MDLGVCSGLFLCRFFVKVNASNIPSRLSQPSVAFNLQNLPFFREKVDADGGVAEWHKYVYNDSNQLVSEQLYNGKKKTSLTYKYDADGNRISETGKIGTDKVQLTYEYTVENRLAAVYDADELLIAAAFSRRMIRSAMQSRI